jgi:hypothetical protein
MNNYIIDGEQAQGLNLEHAALSLGYTNVRVSPSSYPISNGRYKGSCDQKSIIVCEWVERTSQLLINNDGSQ